MKNLASIAALVLLGTGFHPTAATSTEHDGQVAPIAAPPAIVMAPRPAREPRQISLLIGVGAYQHEYFIIENNQRFRSRLTGTTNDVNRMKASLRGWGFAEGPEQRVLLDRSASKQGIADAFRWVAERATDSSDVVVIYYSGHGSWAPDANGDEEDGFDEAIVPWDTREMHNPAQLVLDDELGDWLNRIGTSNITVIIDACHSGSTTRGAGDEFPRARGPKSPQAARAPLGGMLSGGDQNLNHVLLTGAAAWELAYEEPTPEGLVFGKFTYHLTEVLKDAPRGSTTYDQVMRLVHARLGVDKQTPQLEGDASAVLFRVHAGVPERAFAVVTPLTDTTVRLDLGAVHGVRPASVFDVYGPNEMSFRGAASAQIRVDSTDAEVSYARVVRGGNVPSAGRAVLSQVPFGVTMFDRLKLYVDPAARDVTAALADLSQWLEVTADQNAAHAVLRRRDDVYQVLVSGEYVAPLRADYDSGRARGDFTRPDLSRGYVGSAAALCGPLQRAYSIAGLQLIQNSTPGLNVEIRVLPTRLTPPARAPSTSVDTAYVGDTVSVWAWVTTDAGEIRRRDVFLTVAVSGFTSEPVSLRPFVSDTRPAVPLTPGEVGGPLLIYRGLPVSPVTGIETIKAVAGVERFDFRDFMRRLPECGRSRNVWATQGTEITGWTVAERRVEFLPRSEAP